MKKKQTVLVTGGAGYIGSHTVVELISAGFEPIIVDDFSNSDRKIIKRLEEITQHPIVYYSIDVKDYDQLKEIVAQHAVTGIIHFAAYKAVGESVAEPLKYYLNNIQTLTSVLQLMLDYSIKNLIFSSSCTVYGNLTNRYLVTEEDPTDNAYSPYGFTKIIGERILKDLVIPHPDLRVLSLRYFNPIGAHPSAKIGELPLGRPNNLVPYITQTAVGKMEQLTVYGSDYPTTDGTCIRDYIHVVDLANAHVKGLKHLLEKQQVPLDFINIGTGKGISVLEMIRKFEVVTKETLNYTIGPKRAGDVSEIYANTEKMKQILDWEPGFSVEEALLHAWNWEKALNDEN